VKCLRSTMRHPLCPLHVALWHPTKDLLCQKTLEGRFLSTGGSAPAAAAAAAVPKQRFEL